MVAFESVADTGREQLRCITSKPVKRDGALSDAIDDLGIENENRSWDFDDLTIWALKRFHTLVGVAPKPPVAELIGDMLLATAAEKPSI
jgi:hypothetical protein